MQATEVDFEAMVIERVSFSFDEKGNLHVLFMPKNRKLGTREIVVPGEINVVDPLIPREFRKVKIISEKTKWRD